MNEWITVLVNIVIGSVIGGVTNELAIRMLFRPYRPWMIGRFRVPFTPGLIPRRREELGMQMGRLVENHLLTKEGIRRAVAEGNLEQVMRSWLGRQAERWLDSEQPLRQTISRIAPSLLAPDGEWHPAVREAMLQGWRSLASGWLDGVKDRPVRDLLPAAGVKRLDQAVDGLGEWLLGRFTAYLRSPEGTKHVQDMLRGVLGGSGGMFGGLVGMFLGDEKVIGKLLSYLEEMLCNPELSRKLTEMVREEADKLMKKPLREVIALIGEDQVAAWIDAAFAKLEAATLPWLDKPVRESLGRFREPIVEQAIPRFAAWAVETLEQNVERVFHKLSIAGIVAREVEDFPLERVEEMIIGISGKEFRMITILGFILGGIIGLVQGLLNLFAH